MSKRLTFMLWIACIIGALAVTPYIYLSHAVPASTTFSALIIIVLIQSSIIYGVACWLSYVIVPKVDLQPFKVSDVKKQVIYPGLIAGIFTGLVLYGFDKIVFHDSLLAEMHPPFWTGILAAFYGGINEEVLLRLFLLTFIYFCLRSTFKNSSKYRTYLVWTSILLATVMFAAGHLAIAFKLAPPTSLEITRVLLLNSIAGIVFGWLYCTWGFWTAALAHGVADLMVHAFLVSFF